MKKKFNIALTPIVRNDDLVQLSQKLSHLSDTYLLKNNSLPHITLYQFILETDLIELTWESICSTIKPHRLQLSLNHFSYTTRDNHLFWIALMPTQESSLFSLHQATATALKLPINEQYDPHLTLINSRNPDYQAKATRLTTDYTPISDTFNLSLGECDNAGQFTRLLKTATPSQ